MIRFVYCFAGASDQERQRVLAMVCRPLCVALGSGGALVIRVPILLGPSAATGALDPSKDVVQRAGQAAPATGQVNPRGRTASPGQPPAGPMVEPAASQPDHQRPRVGNGGGGQVQLHVSLISMTSNCLSRGN